jgi:hypothetical protein
MAPEVTKIGGTVAEYELKFPDELDCHIGGLDTDTGNKFLPDVKLSKWSGEAFFKLENKNVVVDAETEVLANDKVEITVAGITQRFYSKDVAIAHLPGGKDEALEWEIEFSSQPPVSSFSLGIDFSPGLRFCYQGELTQEEIDHGAVRPDEVVGSYAVYWDKMNNQYKAGKFCHIYRPKLTDDNGDWVWVDIDIDPVLKKMPFILLCWVE